MTAEQLVDRFNSTFPPGSKCHWRSIGKDGVPYQIVTVKHAATVMVGGQAVAWFEERGSCCSIEERFVNYNIVPAAPTPIDMIIHCPNCGVQHIDAPDPTKCMDCGHSEPLHAKSDDRPRCYGDDCKGIDTPSCECKKFNPWTNPPHKKHRCLNCNKVFKVANVPTNGVEELVEL